MIDAALVKPPTFTVIVVHSFSRFFRDQFQFEFYVRKLAKNGVRLISITQDLGDDPMSVMMRQIMTLFDEYQSKENAKHTLRAMKENARQRYWNGALPPIGYRIVAAEQRGAKIKKKLEIDPIHADTVRLIYRLALNGDGDRGRREEWNERRRGHIAELRKRAARRGLTRSAQLLQLNYSAPRSRRAACGDSRLRRDASYGTKMEPIGVTICVRSRSESRSSTRVKSASSARKPNCYGHLIAAAGVESAAAGVRSFIPKWRATVDEDGHYSFAVPL